MNVDSNELNKCEAFSEQKVYYNENKSYFKTIIKKKKKKTYSNLKDVNLLLNSLKDFSVKYELDNQNEQKFIIDFNELISLISLTLETQIKLYNCLLSESDNLKNISQEFINNLIYYIYSYKKFEKINNDKSSTKNVKSFFEKENTSINANKTKSKKVISIVNKNPYYWIAKGKVSNNENIKNEKYKESKNSHEHIKSENNINNECDQNTKSYFRRSWGLKLFSPEKIKNDEKMKNESKNKNCLNRSVERRHYTIFSNFASNEKENLKKRINKSNEKRKSALNIKNENKNKNKALSIYTVCQNLRSSSFLSKNHKNREFICTEKLEKKENNIYDSNLTINLGRNESKNLALSNKNINMGVKKKIITNNVPKPSNLANKLLQNGRKFIKEFNGIKEEERKKQYY